MNVVEPGFTAIAASGVGDAFAVPAAGHTWINIVAVLAGIEPLISYMVALVEAPAVVGSAIVGDGTAVDPLVVLMTGTTTSSDSCIVDRFVAVITNWFTPAMVSGVCSVNVVEPGLTTMAAEGVAPGAFAEPAAGHT